METQAKDQKRFGCSVPFLWFAAGLMIGWAIAAIGEQDVFTPGTCIGAVAGAGIGLWIGIALAIRPKTRVSPPAPNPDGPRESN